MFSFIETWSVGVKAVVVFAGVVAGGYILRTILIKWIEAFSAKTKTRLDDIIIHAIKGPSLLWFVLLGIYLASRLVIHEQPLVRLWVDRVSLVFWIISLTWAAARFAGEAISEYSSKLGEGLPVTSLTRNLAKISVYIIGLLFVFQALHISITPMLTALGVGGLAVALALQDTLSNLFSGMYLMMARQVHVGDYVKLDSGQEGYVADITWRTTTIRALANNNILVPNAKMAQAIITNYTTPEPSLSLIIGINVAYSSDLEQVEKVILEETLAAAEEVPGLLKEPPPLVRLSPGFGEFALNLSLICQIREFADQYLVQHHIRKRLLKRFREENITIPYPHRIIQIENEAHNYPTQGKTQE
jgi:small-conductance mechanosensitive channel